MSQPMPSVTDLEQARAWCLANGMELEIRSGEKWRVWVNGNWGYALSDDLMAAVNAACMEAKRKFDAFGGK